MNVPALVLAIIGVVLAVVACFLVRGAKTKQKSWQRMLGSGGRIIAWS